MAKAKGGKKRGASSTSKAAPKRPKAAGAAKKKPVAPKTAKKTASKTAPSKVAPSKAAPSKVAPSKAAPSKAAPSKVAPSKVAPSKAAPSKAAPSKVAPSKVAPSKVAVPSEAAPRPATVAQTGAPRPLNRPTAADVRAAVRRPVEGQVAATGAKSRPSRAPKPSARELGLTVDGYVTTLAPWQRDIIAVIRDVVRTAAPAAVESIKWGQPVYESNGPFAYIKAHNTTVNFGFWRGTLLSDPRSLLQGEGDRMKHVKLMSPSVDRDALAAFVKQAISLNATLGDPTKTG